MRIGDVATRSGIPAKTIRYYEEIGVLLPPRRTPAGYRDYDETVLDRLAFIRAAQAVGLTLGEIRGILALRDRDEVPCGHVLELLGSRSLDLDRRISELQALRTELRHLVEQAAHLDPAACDPRAICHIIVPAR